MIAFCGVPDGVMVIAAPGRLTSPKVTLRGVPASVAVALGALAPEMLLAV
jgi:hypothetical protein